MSGWIKLHREIKDHWIWQDSLKLKWWLDILLTVNHAPAKVNIGMQLYDCDKGQSIMSLSSWADRWKVSKDKARNFLVLLEKDGMITHESLGKTTRITVCNYDSCQSDLHDNQTQSQRKANDSQTLSHTNKKNKKNKKIDNKETTKVAKKDTLSLADRQENFKNSLVPHVEKYGRELIRAFFDYWSEPNTANTKMRFELQRTWDIAGRLRTWERRSNERK